jgi:putative ABC transport system permease protein
VARAGRASMSAAAPRGAPRTGWRLPFSAVDVKLGARMLLKHPLMTLVSVVSLAVGIPVGLAPMAMIDAMEAPLPVHQGDRVLGLRYWNREQSQAVSGSEYDYALWREELRSFKGLGAVRIADYNVDSGTGMGGPIAGAEVTASTFPVLQTAPLLGRALTPADEAIGGPNVVVLGYDLWQSRFGGDRGVVNRTVRIGGVVHTVVGVMPKGFLFPIHEEMWLPLRQRPAGEPGRGAALQVFGRLADGATPEKAEAELAVVRQRMSAQFPDVYKFLNAEAVPFAIAMQGSPRGGWRSLPGTWLIDFGAVVLLMVACANVGLLIFARTAGRSAELSMRAALGADRTRIVAQVFIEVLVLAVVSTVVGLLLIELLSNRLLATMWSPASGGLPWWIDVGVTPGMVVKALLLAVFSAALSSILPTLRVTGSRMQDSIRRAGATGSGTRLGPISSALIVVDMAMAVAVVGLLVGVSQRMANITRGEADFPADQFLSAEVALSDPAPSMEADTAAAAAWAARIAPIQRTLVERLQAESGVRGVAVANVLPRMDHGFGLAEVQGGTPGDRFGAYDVDVARVDPGFFAGLGQPVVAGRDFNVADLQGDRRAVIVNRTFAERTLGGKSPVGRRFRYRSPMNGDPGPWYEIVGMVPDLATNLMEPQHGLGVYHPAAPGEIYPIRLAIHLGPNPTTFAPRLRDLAGRVDPAVIVTRTEPLDKVFPEGWYMLVWLRIGWSVFVGVLLALAISGMYTMMALSVAQRTREIGIRTALGAPRGHVVATIGRRAAIQLGIGALIGIPLAGLVYFRVQAQYDTTAPSAVVVALVPGVTAMLLIGLLACTAPLLRALRIMPTEAMRAEP